MESTSIHTPEKPLEQTAKREVKSHIVWQYAIGLFLLHLAALYGLCISILSAKFLTWLYGKLKRYSW
jgi:hypothetical protein